MKDAKSLIRFDWAMKRLLRDKANFGVLEGFLTSLLGREIKILRLLESESNMETCDSKQNRVDIMAESNDGEKMLIEVQNEAEDTYFHRMLFASSRLVSEYIKRGSDYGKISKVYSVNIVYFNLGEGTDYVYHGKTEFHGIHNNELLRLPAHLKKRFRVEGVSDLYPEYYILRVNDFDKWSKVPLDQWMYFLSTSTIPDDADAPGLAEARQRLAIDRLSEAERNAYYDHLENMNSMRNVLDDAVNAAKFYGHKEGLQEGFEKGRMEEKIAIARSLKASGVPTEIIQNTTGLSAGEIYSL